MNNITKITNGLILTPSGWINDADVIVSNGKITGIEPAGTIAPDQCTTIDALGGYIVPGAIDIHVHGAANHDFMEADTEAWDKITLAHAMHGTTSMLATLAVSPPELIDRCINLCREKMQATPSGAEILGLHLEGNYLNPAMAGAQDPRYITDPVPEEYMSLINRSAGVIRRWSAAPELPGAIEFASACRKAGILVALAHTKAGYDDISRGLEAGFTHATHFYNAMTGMHKCGIYKHEGTIEAVYLHDDISVEVIADGIHVPPHILQLVHKIKGTKGIALVTDAMSAAACEEGGRAFDPRTIVEDGVCKMADRSALAGSIATADRLIRTMVKEAGLPLADAVEMSSSTPARIIGVDDRKGSIAAGFDADIVIYDSDLTPRHVLVAGQSIL